MWLYKYVIVGVAVFLMITYQLKFNKSVVQLNCNKFSCILMHFIEKAMVPKWRAKYQSNLVSVIKV